MAFNKVFSKKEISGVDLAMDLKHGDIQVFHEWCVLYIIAE